MIKINNYFAIFAKKYTKNYIQSIFESVLFLRVYLKHK